MHNCDEMKVMITCDFNNFKTDAKKWQNLISGLGQYVTIMQNVNSKDILFKETFCDFYQLTFSTWKRKKTINRFFSSFDELINLAETQKLTYADVLNKLQPINNSVEKSFASKIFHTIYSDKPIIDKNVLKKLSTEQQFNGIIKMKKDRKTGQSVFNPAAKYDIQEAIDLYKELELYYDNLISANQQYLDDFENEFTKMGLPAYAQISKTKMIDFYLWIN